MTGVPGSGMWRVGLLLLWVTVATVQGDQIQETCCSTGDGSCEAKKPARDVTSCTFDMGSDNDAILEAKGDIAEGCMFKYTSSDKTTRCCYIQYPISNNNNLCNPTTYNEEKCRDNNTYRVVEKITGNIAASKKCILRLYNVRFSDAGDYMAVFPGDRSHDHLFHVKSSGMDGAVIFLIIVIVLIPALCAVLSVLYCFYEPWTKFVDKTVDCCKTRCKTRREEVELENIEGQTDSLLNGTGESLNATLNTGTGTGTAPAPTPAPALTPAPAPAQVASAKTEYCTTHSAWVAASHCEVCNKYMCESCKESHGNSATTGGHQVKVLAIQCDCKDTISMRVGRWRNSENKDRKYFECEKAKDEGKCRFFKWAGGPLSPDAPKAAKAAEVVPSKVEYCTTCSTQPWLAASHCEECDKYMCESCKESHANSETTRGHEVEVLTIKCDCKDTISMRVGRWRNSENKNRKYFECAKRKGEGKCSFFKWAEGPLSPDVVKQRDQD